MAEQEKGGDVPVAAGLNWPLVILLLAVTTILQAVTPLGRIETTYRVVDAPNAEVLAGLLSAAFAILPVMLFRRIGTLGDTYGERPMLLAGALLVGVAVLLLTIRSDLVIELFAANAALGLGQMVLLSALQVAIVRCAPPEEHDRLLGYFLVAISTGMALAPLLLSWVSPDGSGPATSLDLPLLVSATLLFAGSALLALLLPRPGPRARSIEIPYRTLLRAPGMLMLIVCSGVCLAVNDSFLVFFPLLADGRGIDVSTVGLLLSLRAIGAMTSRFLFARIIKRVGKRKVMAFTMLATGASIAALVLDLPVPVVAALLVLSGFGLGLAIACSLSLTLGQAPAVAKARAASLRLSVARLAQFAFPLAAGAGASIFGAASVFALMGVVLAAGGAWTNHSRVEA